MEDMNMRTATKAEALRTANWHIRVEAPAYLEEIGLTAEASALRDLPEIVDASSALAGLLDEDESGVLLRLGAEVHRPPLVADGAAPLP